MNLATARTDVGIVTTTQSAQNNVLVECISDVAREMLGQNGADVLLFHLHLDDEGSTDVRTIHERLHELLSTGAYGLETVIVEELFRRMRLPSESLSSLKPLDFVELVQKAGKLNPSPAPI